jgi:dynein heavy chain 1
MELLMKEGAQVEDQISKSEEVLKQVQIAVGKFEQLANTCRDLFVLLEAMRETSFLYEFSANMFMGVLDYALKSPRPDGQTDEDRITTIKSLLFTEIAARAGRGLQIEDKLVFALLLARLFSGEQKTLSADDAKCMEDLVRIISEVFGTTFPWSGRGLNELKRIVASEVSSSVPLLLCSAPGHDVSGRVESMAREMQRELMGVAMGSAEGYETADKYFATATKRGTWVMLKNCHLCTDWLRETLVKKLQSLGGGTHPDFRIFITSEINPKLPTGLLRISDVVIAEAPSGVKASISRFWTSISSERLGNPVRNRIYLILAWVHAVIQERLRYIPAGWTEKYEFTEADARHALDAFDSLIESAFGVRQQLDPEKLPWDAIRSTLCKGVFGGRITKEMDQTVLNSLVSRVFTPKCFDVSFVLADAEGAPVLPDGSSADEILNWIENLPEHTPPTWIGLDNKAEEARELTLARSVRKKVATVGTILESLIST